MIFRNSRFRLVARILAMLLLAWTSADLCGHGVCTHDREPIVPWASPGPAGPTSVGGPNAPQPEPTTDDGPDDCFCCCHCIDVQVRFQLPLTYSFISMVVVERPSLPLSIPSPFDHPPHV